MNTLVDADVHNVLSSNEELFDFPPDYWIHMIRDGGSFPAKDAGLTQAITDGLAV